MINKVKSAVEKYNMLEMNDSVTVCLSGGADSVALLYAMLELKSCYNLNIQAVHINHQLRGAESDRDEDFCRSLCKKLDIPIFCKRIDVAAHMKQYGTSCEESARILRYQAFDEYSDGGKIATAHTLSDNAETIIHNLARGTGLKGLTGIPPVRANIIRPLILAERAEVEAYLKDKSQDFVTDSTNLTDDYTRNKIRHNIIPQLQKINPSFFKTIASDISVLQLEESFIAQASDEAYKKCLVCENRLENLKDYHKAIRNRCIAAFLNNHGLRYSSDRIEAVDSILLHNGKINISQNVYIISEKGILFIEYVHEKNECSGFEMPLNTGRNFIYGKKFCDVQITLNENCVKTQFINTNLANSALDYDKIIGVPVIRSRKSGDKIRLQGRNFTSSVKKTLINLKIPVEQRSSLCFIEDDEGLVFAEKIGIADRVKPDSSTKRLMIISIGCEI